MVVQSRIAAVLLPGLPLEVVFGDLVPRKNAKPSSPTFGTAAVVAELRGRKVLIAVSEEAERQRVLAGMTQTEGRARLPELRVKSRNPELEWRRLHNLGELLFSFGPIVEVCPPSHLFVEVGRSRAVLAKKFGGREPTDAELAQAIINIMRKAGHQAHVVIARDPDVARSFLLQRAIDRRRRLAETAHPKKRGKPRPRRKKRAAPQFDIIAAGHEKSRLADLSTSALLWTELRLDPDGKTREMLRNVASSLDMLGIHDVRRLLALPSEQMGARFGEEGSLLMKRVHAETKRPLIPFIAPARLEESFELDRGTEDLSPILFILKRLFDRLEARLTARAQAAAAIDLRFLIEPDVRRVIKADAHQPRSSKREATLPLRFARPTRRASTMLSLAREVIGSALPGRVLAIEVEARAPTNDQGAQLDLFSSYAKRVETVGALIGRIKAALGEDAVFTPELRNSHRPEAAWACFPFEIERTLREVAKRAPDRRAEAVQNLDLVEASPASAMPLPRVSAGLSVTGAVSKTPETEAPDIERAAWPKPVPRKPEDEPLPQLPARPLALFETPEPVTLLAVEPQADVVHEDTVLRWRGRRLEIESVSEPERLEAEWWTPAPLVRDYVIAEAKDGRQFWLFREPNGRWFVHGIFD